jgi:hypothetical protein
LFPVPGDSETRKFISFFYFIRCMQENSWIEVLISKLINIFPDRVAERFGRCLAN